jgi:hypothetical protein
VLLFLPASVEAQTGSASVTLRATVSETVALSILPNSIQGDVSAHVVSSGGNTVQITLSGNDADASVIRVPLLVRSNSGFKVSAVFESQTAELDQLSVTGVQATGSLVSPQSVNSLEMSLAEKDTSQPLLVLTGPRISLGGSLNSPNNALKITLLIRLKPQPVSGWLVRLTLAGTAEPLTQ